MVGTMFHVEQKIMIINKKKTYFAFIENSVNTEMFKDVYISSGKATINVTKGGELACAVYLSSLLFLFKMIKKTHATVKATIADMKESNWRSVNKPKKGDVLIWDYKDGHRHLGFYIDENTAISNSTRKKRVWTHHPTYNNNREIIEILRYTNF
ncbi:MAG: NlpC/P60 family protein [Candidatus Komeilibacteria bacterium]